ncbi:hypothetical protein GGR54DRAFT_360271 [Hypoxylon sp. NC1633]|nr:hypothetical protein GGR54DRAFT_360271 [Hypoxylon sp. NC1633]
MTCHFPNSISAARIATFVSTAAWIQGASASASEASLTEEALNNFLQRHGVTTVPPREVPASTLEEEEEEEESVDSADLDDDASEAPFDEPISPADQNNTTTANQPNPPQTDIATDATSGQPEIQSTDPPALSAGAKAAIGIWSAVAVVVIAGLILFFVRRRNKRNRTAQEQISALRGEELARSQQMSISQSQSRAPEPQLPMAKPAYLGHGPGDGRVRPPSGQWMPTPPWQDDAPTWRDPHPWRQSRPSVVGLPPRPGLRPPFALSHREPPPKPEFDRRTEVTAETESTIFAYR